MKGSTRLKLSDVARIWQEAGVSVIPIMANQTKRPAIKWSPYQATLPTLNEISEWWGNGKPFGLALICGAVSGNMEMTEIEGRAMSGDTLTEVVNRCEELGVGHIWDLLNSPVGYSEMSPSGGIHLLYRIPDHEVPGNTKIASEPGEHGEPLVLAETRGHGGYVIVAPTPGICHPSGEPWDLINGDYGHLPLITWAERNLLHEALRLALDKMPVVPAALPATQSPPSVAPGSSAAGSSPGDDFEATTDWAEILEPFGWQLESRHGTERHWTRPGKDRHEGASATTGRASDRDRLYVFSSSTIFDTEVPYTKFGAFALLNHGGDHAAAARDLVRLGYGERAVMATLDSFVSEVVSEEPPNFTLDDVGNAQRLWFQARDRVRYVWDQKQFLAWDGKCWAADKIGLVHQEWFRATETMAASDDEYVRKHGAKCRQSGRINAAVDLLKAMPGCSVPSSEFNKQRQLLNLGNGVLDLKTGVLHPHSSRFMQTRTFGASHRPGAICPNWESFLEAALPDPGMRTYLKRALGYSLLGEVDQRSIFWIYGPPGTGKSTLTETMREVFGGYGTTAPSGTFRSRKGEQGPNNDLHDLRGRRFVTSSETAESTTFDEDLLKRLSGRDSVQSRALYQDFQEWIPECAIWMATNNAPRFTTDDDAIWRRTKLIPFLTVFEGSEEHKQDFSRNYLLPEADGILNWLLTGLQEYLEHGLGEPATVRQMAVEQRVQSDSVARFMDERILDGILVENADERIRASELSAMYQEWSRQVGERPVTNRRFTNRMTSNFPELRHMKIGGHTYWIGVGRANGVGILGAITSRAWDPD